MPSKVPEDSLGGVGCDVGVCAGLTRDDGVDVSEADVVAVEAVALIDLCESRVAGLNEGYIDALESRSTVSHIFTNIVHTHKHKPQIQ